MEQASLNDLVRVIDQVPERDKGFANDLITKGRKYGLSQKQAYWVDKLYRRATGNLTPEEQPPQEKLFGDLKPMMVMLQFAGTHLKHPKVRLLLPSCAAAVAEANDRGEQVDPHYVKMHTLRLGVAGERSQYAGQVNVTDDFPYGQNEWYGRIDKDGNWTQPRKHHDLTDEVKQALNDFSADPVQAASAYGKLMGFCCFCHRKLTDKRSTDVGYGPDCAKHWGLPWGSKS